MIRWPKGLPKSSRLGRPAPTISHSLPPTASVALSDVVGRDNVQRPNQRSGNR